MEELFLPENCIKKTIFRKQKNKITKDESSHMKCHLVDISEKMDFTENHPLW